MRFLPELQGLFADRLEFKLLARWTGVVLPVRRNPGLRASGSVVRQDMITVGDRALTVL